MADSYANYAFLPWVRQGLSRFLSTEDSLQQDADASSRLPVRLRINDASLIDKTIRIMGPGDVVGLEARQIVRREPERQSKSFIPNYFASIEFRSPDLPWMLTPLRPDSQNRLRPWLCLVVVKQQDGVRFDAESRQSVSRLSISNPAVPADELPPLNESWAWAHAQVTLTEGDTRSVAAIMAESPQSVISRLLCPRRLEPRTSYYACVVPCFRAGVAAALGLDTVTDLSPAWTPDMASVTVPVYDSWEFTTGPAGDFEALVRLLKPQPVPAGVGVRPIDIGDPRWGDPAAFGIPMTPAGQPARVVTDFEGALRPPTFTRASLPPEVRSQYPARLEQIIDASVPEDEDDDPDPIVAPPMYGRWHAGVESLPEQEPRWIRDLNLDPRDRGVAGFGAQVVRRHQEALMHSAWSQVDRITQANSELRRGKVAEAVGTAFKEKHFDSMSVEEIIEMTSSVHGQLMMSPVTLREKITTSRLPDRAVSAAFRRIKRPGGPLARGFGATGGIETLAGLNDGAVAAAEPHVGFSGTFTSATLAEQAIPSLWPKSWLEWLPMSGALWALITLVLVVAGLGLAGIVGAVALGAALLTAALSAHGFMNRKRFARASSLMAGGPSASELADLAIDPQFRLDFGDEAQPDVDDEVAVRNVELFRQAAMRRQNLLSVTNPIVDPLPLPEPIEIDVIAETLLLRLDPALHARLRFADRVTRPADSEPDDPLDEIMVYPEFDAPMYEALRDEDQDFVLPGLQHVRTNSITLLETNRRFIEAFMVGINHEMSRELRWREYPTDQRGSYFRQFWDPRGRIPAATTKEMIDARRDIRELHTWRGHETLGLAGLPDGGEEQKLVLLIRGELLRRFPTAQIYAQAARFGGSGDRMLGSQVRHPLFRGTLKPDVHFLGFDLDYDEAFGSVVVAENRPGWFFVIQQQPTEPRFGLDVATAFAHELPALSNWDDLTWGHFAATEEAFAALSYLSPHSAPDTVGGSAPSGVAWGRDAAANAFITLQKPVRIAIHADDMLQPEDDDA